MTKRGAEELELPLDGQLAQTLAQKPKVDPEGSWSCLSCGNLNWPLRTTCNRKGCHMPRAQADASALTTDGQSHPEGSWACLGCGNVNWPKRTTCNNKTCNLPRDGMNQVAAMMGMSGNGVDPTKHPAGSWACAMCNNINWPQRDTCNTKGCGASKATAALPPNMGMMGGMGGMAGMAGMGGMGAMGGMGGMAGMGGMGDMGAMGAMGGMGMGGMGGAMGQNPYGAYGQGGAMSQYGMPVAAPMQQLGGAPAGSWPCPSCHNINWPKRDTCNTKGCDVARPVGAGTADGSLANPPGSWECPTCQNMNWPKRTSCNKQGCDTPRPM